MILLESIASESTNNGASFFAGKTEHMRLKLSITTNFMNELLPLENFFAETLKETLEGVEQTQEAIAKSTGIPKQHLSEMKLGKRRCTPEYDLRLSRYFSTSAGFWLRLQLDYELMKAEREKGAQIKSEVEPAA